MGKVKSNEIEKKNGKVKRTEIITNEEVLENTILNRSIISDSSNRQIAFFGHVMRKSKLEDLAVTCKIAEKRARRKTIFTD